MRPDDSLPAPSSSAPAESAVQEARRALRDAARRVLSRRFRVVFLVRDAYERMLSQSDVLSSVWSDMRTMLRLLLRWTTRSYRQVSWTPLIVIVGALLYFITPLDAIPDSFGAFGFVDDVAVIEAAVRTVRSELRRFRNWERGRALPE